MKTLVGTPSGDDVAARWLAESKADKRGEIRGLFAAVTTGAKEVIKGAGRLTHR